MSSAHETRIRGDSKMELMSSETEDVVKRSTLKKYQILCAVSIALCFLFKLLMLRFVALLAQVSLCFNSVNFPRTIGNFLAGHGRIDKTVVLTDQQLLLMFSAHSLLKGGYECLTFSKLKERKPGPSAAILGKK